MKRRKLTALCLALALMMTLLAGCGAASKGEGAAPNENYGAEEESFTADMAEAPEAQAVEPGDSPDAGETARLPAKLIYRGNLEMETTAFDDAAAGLQKLVKACGGYVESSNVHNYSSGY